MAGKFLTMPVALAFEVSVDLAAGHLEHYVTGTLMLTYDVYGRPCYGMRWRCSPRDDGSRKFYFTGWHLGEWKRAGGFMTVTLPGPRLQWRRRFTWILQWNSLVQDLEIALPIADVIAVYSDQLKLAPKIGVKQVAAYVRTITFTDRMIADGEPVTMITFTVVPDMFFAFDHVEPVMPDADDLRSSVIIEEF